jgi:hypothetical protein
MDLRWRRMRTGVKLLILRGIFKKQAVFPKLQGNHLTSFEKHHRIQEFFNFYLAMKAKIH